MCAGTRKQPGSAASVISSRSRESRPRIGRPSEARLPILASAAVIRSAASKLGAYSRWCDLPGPLVAAVDGGDLDRQHETHRARARGRGVAVQPPFQLRPDPEQPGLGLDQGVLQLGAHAGWVKSPVPSTVRPLRRAHQDRCSMSQSLLHARENREWIWRSAVNIAGLILPQPTVNLWLAELLHPADQLLHERGGHRVVRAADRDHGQHVGARHGDQRVQQD